MKQRFTTWRFVALPHVNVVDPQSLDSAGPRMIGKRFDADSEEFVLDSETAHFTGDQRAVSAFSHYFADALAKGELLPGDAATAAHFGVPMPRVATSTKAEK